MEVGSGCKLVVAVDYGTTFTSEKACFMSIRSSFILLTNLISSWK